MSSRYHNISNIKNHLSAITQFLGSPLVSSLFALHPNDLGRASFKPPEEWQEWWSWAGAHIEEGCEDPWVLLLRYYDACRLQDDLSINTFPSIPPSLCSLISDAASLALPRQLGRIHYPSGNWFDEDICSSASEKRPTLPGMSPKKAHEVVQMSGCIYRLLSLSQALRDVEHAVDIGAGQVRAVLF